MLSLPASVTIAEASDAMRALASAAPHESGAELALDAAALERFDTSALAVVLECKRIAHASGKRFALVNAPAHLVELANLYGLTGLLDARA